MITETYEFIPGGEYIPITIKLGIKENHPVDRFIKKLISFDPKDRPTKVEDIIQEVDQLLGSKKKKEELELSKMQRRIMKYIQSCPLERANLSDILDYVANFYGVERKPKPGYSPFGSILDSITLQNQLDWAEFADMVDNSLEQLEEAGLLVFERGKYSVKADGLV